MARPHLRFLRLLAAALLLFAPTLAWAAPKPAATVVVIGMGGEDPRLAHARQGVDVAVARWASHPDFADGIRVETLDDGGTAKGLKKAIAALKKLKPSGIVALPSSELAATYWKEARRIRVPWFWISGEASDGVLNPGTVWHLTPSPVYQAIFAADGMIAPFGARRVGVLHEDTQLGQTLAAGFTRNLSSRIKLAGIHALGTESGGPATALSAVRAFEADWVYVALTGRHLAAFMKQIEKDPEGLPKFCFADGARSDVWMDALSTVLDGSAFVGGPDPELQGRDGERLVEALDNAAAPITESAVRAYAGALKLLGAIQKAGTTKLREVRTALDPETPQPSVLGKLGFQPHGGIRFYPLTWWQVGRGRIDLMQRGLLPTAGCGAPLGFGRPSLAPRNEAKGRIGYLYWGDEGTRTIEQDLLELGLSTGGKDPEIDAFVREEILARAMRIAHQLFRREPDGTPIPGHSWGMSLTTERPSTDTPRNKVWLAICAGDDKEAGGRVLGDGLVAVYTTFLKRTMYITRKLRPAISSADKPLLDGSYPWGTDRANNHRVDKIRCLIDGFASAVGLTLAHEYGHLCSCQHDQEHPSSIMNVVAGAGKSWEVAVWIPAHERLVTRTLGIETSATED